VRDRGLEDRLPVEVETAVFRVVQEALTNVVRHAKAETVLVQMARENGELAIEVEDDGAGLRPGLGLDPRVVRARIGPPRHP